MAAIGFGDARNPELAAWTSVLTTPWFEIPYTGLHFADYFGQKNNTQVLSLINVHFTKTVGSVTK